MLQRHLGTATTFRSTIILLLQHTGLEQASSLLVWLIDFERDTLFAARAQRGGFHH